MKSSENNIDSIEEAKSKEIQNLEDFNAFKEVEDDGHQVLDTRYVITEKPDGSIKARYVVKGFQETSPKQSDSPSAGRETLKL